ncbi:hypothetical protein [Hymenobacter swuensis]|uniref:Uncharacterized protein n=1 Tax=Hymenobacter swuensis DY53 TaxID=1227739 RepID=W8FB20_9BACT|nr:hypothetical protein [Hymenobacter swuensis]AHJ98890.1 hypothetical protein Hsw_3295 [Hymenobacter swuensis DY53]
MSNSSSSAWPTHQKLPFDPLCGFPRAHEHLAVDTYSRRYRIQPQKFIRKMREMEIDACQLI